MKIVKVAGLALAGAGLAGCASSSLYEVNRESKAIIEKSVPNGTAVYDSLIANLPSGNSLGDPKPAVVLRDFAVKAAGKSTIDSLKKLLSEKSDSIMFMNAQIESKEAALPARLRMATDSVDNHWAGKLVREKAVAALYATDYLDSTKAALIAQQKEELDSITNVYQKDLAKTNKTWKRKLAKVKEADSLKSLADRIAVESKVAAQRTADSIKIERLRSAIRSIVTKR